MDGGGGVGSAVGGDDNAVNAGGVFEGQFAAVVQIAPVVVKPVTRWSPQQDSNLRTWFRKPMLYPLSYGGDSRFREGFLKTGSPPSL